MYKILIILSIATSTVAFNLTPLSQTIYLGQNKNTTIYQVENKTKEPMALEMSIVKRIMDINGKEEKPDAEDGEFLVFPTQVILKPGQKRGIKVQWLKKGDIKVEKNYRLLVEQLPIDFSKKKGNGIKMLLRYLGTLYIGKREFRPNISKVKWKKRKKSIEFIVTNTGQRHQILGDLKVVVKEKSGKKFVLKAKDLRGFSGENILAQSKRIFSLPLASFPKVNFIGASVDIEYE